MRGLAGEWYRDLSKSSGRNVRIWLTVLETRHRKTAEQMAVSESPQQKASSVAAQVAPANPARKTASPTASSHNCPFANSTRKRGIKLTLFRFWLAKSRRSTVVRRDRSVHQVGIGKQGTYTAPQRKPHCSQVCHHSARSSRDFVIMHFTSYFVSYRWQGPSNYTTTMSPSCSTNRVSKSELSVAPPDAPR